MQIDINSDLGEGFGAYRIADDEALFQLITSANVACGFHAGDPTTMDHPSAYQDHASRWARNMPTAGAGASVSPTDLRNDISPLAPYGLAQARGVHIRAPTALGNLPPRTASPKRSSRGPRLRHGFRDGRSARSAARWAGPSVHNFLADRAYTRDSMPSPLAARAAWDIAAIRAGSSCAKAWWTASTAIL